MVMSQNEKLLLALLSGRNDKNFSFHDLCHMYYSKDDEAYIVEVPELPGCMADGATREEALRNAERIMQEWIETARLEGIPIPEAKGRLLYA